MIVDALAVHMLLSYRYVIPCYSLVESGAVVRVSVLLHVHVHVHVRVPSSCITRRIDVLLSVSGLGDRT